MCLAKSHGAKEDNVGFVLHELQPEEILDRHAVDLFGPAPGELVEGFYNRKAGVFDAAEQAVAAQIKLPLGKPGEIIDVA